MAWGAGVVLKHAAEVGRRVLDANANMCGVCDGVAGLWLAWLLWSACMMLVVAETVGGCFGLHGRGSMFCILAFGVGVMFLKLWRCRQQQRLRSDLVALDRVHVEWLLVR